jgi:hypothetical protein
MTVVLSFMLVAMLALGGLAIGLAQIQLARVEAQIVADCSSLSGAYLFGETHVGDLNTPTLMAQGMPSRNTILGRTANIGFNDVVLGRVVVGSSGAQTFIPNANSPNAVKVTMRLGNGGAMASPKLLFPFLMDIDSFSLERSSISSKMAHDVVLVMDRSGSMNLNLLGTGFPFDPRLQRTREHPHPTQSRWGIMLNSLDPLFNGFAASKIEERFALVTFGSDIGFNFAGRRVNFRAAERDIDLTPDSNRIKRHLARKWDDVPMVGATRIDAGIDTGVTSLTGELSRDFAFKTIILLTDGEQFPASRLHIEAARRAAEKGVTIHAIAFSGGANFSDMEEVARIGGGKAFLAPDSRSLEAAFREISTMAPVAIIE